MRYILTILFTLSALFVDAQNIALKTNLIYDAAQTANMGLEIGLGQRTTLDISGNYNGWYTNKDANKKMRHFLVQPEFRYYFCEKLNGHFIGVHGIVGEYNVNGKNKGLTILKRTSSLKDIKQNPSRYEGTGYGGGIAYGYSAMLSSRLNLEFTIGIGYIHLDYDRYGTYKCSPYIESATNNYIGITKAGIALVYIIK